MNSESPVEELLARIAQQDVAAFSELYDRCAPRVYGLITHILQSREPAEDALQEVFMRLWIESPNLNENGGSVLAWLVVTSRDVAVQRLRGERKSSTAARVQSATPVTEGAKRATKPAGGKSESQNRRVAESTRTSVPHLPPLGCLPKPKEIALIDNRLTLLYKVLDQLPKPQRQALDLAVFVGLNESEIAQEMGEPLGKIQRSLRAAVTFVKHRRRAVCGTWAANI